MSHQYRNKMRQQHKKKQPWPVIILITVGSLMIIGALLAFRKPSEPKVAVEVTGAPSLKVDRDKVDLGYVKLGQTVDVKFTLSNVGDQTLRFSKAPYIEVVEGC